METKQTQPVEVVNDDGGNYAILMAHMKRVIRGTCYVCLRALVFQTESVVSVEELASWYARAEDLKRSYSNLNKLLINDSHPSPPNPPSEASSQCQEGCLQVKHISDQPEAATVHVVEQESQPLVQDKATNELRLPFLVIDARRPDEFQESHMYGAVNVPYVVRSSDEAVLAALPPYATKDTVMVTYCAVGLRSGLLQKKLRALGYKNVSTLAGGYYKWVNEGRVIYAGPEVAKGVMPQNIVADLTLLDSRYNIKKLKAKQIKQEKAKNKLKQVKEDVSEEVGAKSPSDHNTHTPLQLSSPQALPHTKDSKVCDGSNLIQGQPVQ